MQYDALQKLYWKNADIIDSMEKMVEESRAQNVYTQINMLRSISVCLKDCLEGVISNYTCLLEAGLSWDMEYLTTVLEQLEKAQSEQDWILLADLYELQMIPALQDVQYIIQTMDFPLHREEWLKENLEVLQEKNNTLYQALLACGENDRIQDSVKTQYDLELASVGYYTMALTEGGARKYLHSNRNPMSEARRFAKRVYQQNQEHYLLYGWGMGYHVEALLEQNPDMDLIVYEPDLLLLYYSLTFGDWKTVLQKVDIVWDPEWKQFNSLIENRELILFRPEVSHIQQESIRLSIENIVSRKDSIDAHEQLFYLNARENIRNCQFYADDLKSILEGKRIVIVAAGPSLDKNIEQLKEKPKDVVIIAVGTVYKLLVKKGIAIDYVIISDTSIYHQIQGMEQSEIPILILATADRRVGQNYQGAKYLICQSGYKMAAEYAEKSGYICYDSGGSVATLALDFAIRMKAASIAFVGLDLAYEGKQAHATGTGKETYGGFDYHQVEGIHGELLNANQSFINYRTWMEHRIRREDVTMDIIDATEGGAKKEGFRIMTLKEYL